MTWSSTASGMYRGLVVGKAGGPGRGATVQRSCQIDRGPGWRDVLQGKGYPHTSPGPPMGRGYRITARSGFVCPLTRGSSPRATLHVSYEHDQAGFVFPPGAPGFVFPVVPAIERCPDARPTKVKRQEQHPAEPPARRTLAAAPVRAADHAQTVR